MYILDNWQNSIDCYPYEGNLNIVTSYADMTNTSFIQGVYSAICPVGQGCPLLPSPDVNTKRQLKGCSIYNPNNDSVTVDIYYNDNSEYPYIMNSTILPFQTLFYTDGVGWYKNNSNDISSTIPHNNLNGIQGGQAGQYYHLNQSKYNDLSGVSITSSATTGIAPFKVSSTTVVSNLNADYVDGKGVGTLYAGGIVVASNATTLGAVSSVASGQILISRGILTTPGWSPSLYLTGTASVTGGITASNFNSTVATGTQPFIIGSTTQVDNLNADMLNGYHATDFSSSFLPLSGGTVTGNLISRNINAQTYNITASRLVSTVATGTSPFLVNSSTVVANLNANTLQGNSASAFAQPAGISSSFASLTGVTNSFATIAHTHPYATYIYTVSNTSSTTQNFTLSYSTILTGLGLTGNIAFPVNTTIYEYVAGMYTEKTGVRATTRSGAGSYLNELTYVYSAVPMTASIAVSFRLA